jgi:hypothetical protein
MRRVGLALAILLAAPAWAQARVHTIAPPGNSGVSQYLETLPTAGGGQPTNSVHPVAGPVGGSGGSSGAGGSGGAAASGGTAGNAGAGGGTPIAASTQRALEAHGQTGAAAAALAVATAPHGSRPAAQTGESRANSSVSAASTSAGSSPATSVFKTLTGSAGGEGLGPLLPLLLIVSLLGAVVVALLRRRRTS